MKIQPELFQGRRVRLNYQLDLCKVRKVETLEIPSIEGRGTFSVQMPEVASAQFRTCLDMPIDHALAVSTYEIDETGKRHTILILCRCGLRSLEESTLKFR